MKIMITYDLIPPSIRWKKSVTGLGTMYSDLYSAMLQERDIQGIKRLDKVMHEIGLKQGPKILKELDMGWDLEGCAYVLLAAHRLFGMKSKIAEISVNKVVINVSHCSWGTRIDGWIPATCSSIAHYETGVVKSILPNATHKYTKKRSLGDDVCELIISDN